jgi:outer membrane protein assembly factor BamE (lipoprotein component of BamABCDE complex)
MSAVQPCLATRRSGMVGPRTPLRRRRLMTACAGFAAIWLLAGCTGEVNTHGDMIQDDRLARIIPLQHSQRDVLAILGSPSTLSVLDGEAWYYIGDRRESVAFFKPELLERETVVVSFNDSGFVTSVEKLTVDEENRIEVVERETPTHGSDLTMVEQFLGNIGRFNTDAPERR